MSRKPLIATVAAASLAVAIGLDWWWDPSRRLARAVAALSRAPKEARFAAGRLSVDREWSAAPSAEARAAPGSASAATLEAKVHIDRLTAGRSGRGALHARGLAAMATGDVDAAIDDLRRALAAPGDAAAPLRSDLAAVLLERGSRQDEPTDVVDALDQAGLALSESPSLPPALFNQALALETLGPRVLGVAAWEQYLAADGASTWAEEARVRLAALRARPVDSRRVTTARLQELEGKRLPEWARRALSNGSAETAALTAAVEALRRETPDREAVDLAQAAISLDSGPAVPRACLAGAILALDEWRAAYDRVAQPEAQQAALAAERELSCARLPTVGARLRWALAGDRNAVFAALGELAAEAESRQYSRIASLGRIARGNSAMRRAELTSGMAELRHARRLAIDAADLELAATADAMMADGHRELGDLSSAWRSLRLALDNLPAATNPRLVYSIVRAPASAALDQGLSAASLPYSKLLIDATAGWDQPVARIIAGRDRARALQTAGLPALASSTIEEAAALVPSISDARTRTEFVAEVQLARGHLASATAPAAAIAPLSDALAFFREQRTSVRMASVLLDRGRAYRGTGNADAARRDWEAAASLVEDQQPAVREEQLRVSRFSALWDVFAELARADDGNAAASLAVVERARARELLDSLAANQRAAPLAGPALWDWLPEGTTAIVYSVLPEGLLEWIVDRNGPRLRQVPVRADALDVLVRRAVKAIADGRDADLDEISTLLLRDLPAGRPDATLLIVPDGPLHFLPFAALSVPGTSSRLVEAWTPVVAPSLSVARSLSERGTRAREDGGVLLFGYPGDAASGLPLLAGVSRELEALERVYGGGATMAQGTAATAEAFAALAPASRIIHVAAHGMVNMAYPSRSYMLLAPGPHDQMLTAPEIASVTLTARPTVVLTACETAVGRVYRGEGQLSLARPFLVAGAASVIAAQLPVNDRVAPAFDAELAAFLRDRRGGAAALAAVQRAWRARGAPMKDWAVFSAIGSLDR